MKHYFSKTFEFEFEIRRLLWIIPSGGADFAEVASTADRIRPGNYESWYQQWVRTAGRVADRGRSFASAVSQGQALLRASRYWQAAEFFLPPQDQRKLAAYQQSKQLFYEGLALIGVAHHQHTVEYDGVPLRSLFIPLDRPKGTVYICGGFDALLEELYFIPAQAALAQGYQVVLYEGPGQSDALRQYGRPFEADWQRPTRAIVDFYTTGQQLTGPRFGVGLSLGGLLMARAASLDEALFDKVVLYNYFPSMIKVYERVMPKLLHRLMQRGFHPLVEQIIQAYVRRRSYMNWQVEHAKWTLGADSLNGLLRAVAPFDETVVAGLQTPALVLAAAQEHFYDYRLARAFYDRLPAGVGHRLMVFAEPDHVSSWHCQVGAYYEATDQMIAFFE